MQGGGDTLAGWIQGNGLPDAKVKELCLLVIIRDFDLFSWVLAYGFSHHCMESGKGVLRNTCRACQSAVSAMVERLEDRAH